LPGGKGLQVDTDVREEALAEEARPGGKALISGVVLAEHVARICFRVVKRFFRHRDHGLHTTVVEEILRELYVDLIGTEVWQFMKQDSADTFVSDPAKQRGGSLLMSLLADEVRQRHSAGEPAPIVSMVGHSAGSIYASNLLTFLDTERASSPSGWHELPFAFGKVIFLAPAVTCQTLARVLALHAAKPLFQQFRMYSLTDAIERGYYEVPVLYPGSLLYIISGLLESEDDKIHDMPIVGMQRYGRTEHPFTELEVVQVADFLRGGSDRLVWSGEHRGPGLNCDSQKHGDFFRTPETVESFLHFLGERVV